MAGQDIVVIGASAGGVEALIRLVGGLRAGLPAAIFVVLHLPPTADSKLPEILSHRGPLPAIAAVPDAARLLTPRQWEVARLVVAGLSNQEIASRLTIAVGTAANHVEHIRARLEVHTRLEIATWFLTHFRGQQLPAERPTSVTAADRRRSDEWQEVHASARRKDELVARSSRLIIEAGQRMQNPSPKTRDILRKAYRNVLTALEADHAHSHSSRTDQQVP